MLFLFIFFVVTILGLILLKIQNRSIFGGIIVSAGTLLFLFTLLLLILEQIQNYLKNGEIISLSIAYIVIPLIFLCICFYFIFNSRTMHTKEGKSFTAKLSALLGANLLITIPLFFYLLSVGTMHLPMILFYGLLFFLLLDLFLSFLFASYVLYSWMYQMIPFKKPVDYIIVLGSGIRSDEVPPLLKSRLDKGIEYYQKNPNSKLIVSGGQGADEPFSEAYAMKKYLLSQNIPTESILIEDKSTTTYENMLFSKKIIDSDWQSKIPFSEEIPSVIFSTNNYHVLRGTMYARRVRLKAEGVGAPTALYFLPTALIREYIALLMHNKWILLALFLFTSAIILLTSLPF